MKEELRKEFEDTLAYGCEVTEDTWEWISKSIDTARSGAIEEASYAIKIFCNKSNQFGRN